MAMAMPGPHPGPWTRQDLLALPDDGRRYEIEEGNLVVSPAPGIGHQIVAGTLYRLLHSAAPAHLRAIEGVGIWFSEVDYLIPDVLVMSKAIGEADSPSPDVVQLVIEIVSPSSKFRDKIKKPITYAQGHIPHFWRVEAEKPSVFVYRLKGDTYEEVAKANAGDRLTVSEPFKVSFDPAELVS
jgi:Uma2 family endonuclease